MRRNDDKRRLEERGGGTTKGGRFWPPILDTKETNRDRLILLKKKGSF